MVRATAANAKYEPTPAFWLCLILRMLWIFGPVRTTRRFELRAGCVARCLPSGEEGCEGGAQGKGAEADPGAGSAEALEAVHNDGLHVEIAHPVCLHVERGVNKL